MEAIIRPEDLEKAFAAAGVHKFDAATVAAVCLHINAGLTSLVSRGDDLIERLQATHRALIRIAAGDFCSIAGFRNHVDRHQGHLDDIWSLTSVTPQSEDPVLLALRDAALALPMLQLMMDAPAEDAPPCEMISFWARTAASSFKAGIHRHKLEQAARWRQRSALFGHQLIGVYVELSGRKPGFSRAAATSKQEGKVSGPLVRFLGSLYETMRSRASDAIIGSVPTEMLAPALETLALWISTYRKFNKATSQP